MAEHQGRSAGDFDVPPQGLGAIDNFWFRWVGDVGETGPDKGKGGKYLLLPPGYKGSVPEGYFVLRSPTYNHWFFLRVFGKPEAAVASVKKDLRIYPLAKAANPPKMKIRQPVGKNFNTIGAIDFSYFEDVNTVVQEEPNAAMDPETLGLLASIGIEKGKPFKPDARMKKILTEAAAVGKHHGPCPRLQIAYSRGLLLQEQRVGHAVHWRQLSVPERKRCAQPGCPNLLLLLRHRHHPVDG